TIAERDLRQALTGPGGSHAVLDVVVDGGAIHSSVLKEYQQHPVRGQITHVDLQEVRLDQPIHASVPLHLVGEAAGTKEGGVLSHVTTEINVEALPMEVPPNVEFDVSGLHVNDSARLDQLQMPAGVTLLDDPETVIATVTPPTRVEEEPGAEGEAAAEAEGAEAAAEGEEPESSADSSEPEAATEE